MTNSYHIPIGKYQNQILDLKINSWKEVWVSDINKHDKKSDPYKKMSCQIINGIL